MSPKHDFLVKRQSLQVLQGEIQECICALCDSLFICQMVLLLNIISLTEYIFTAKPNYASQFLVGKENMPLPKNICIYKAYSGILMNRTHLVNTSTLLRKTEIHLTNSKSYTFCFL